MMSDPNGNSARSRQRRQRKNYAHSNNLMRAFQEMDEATAQRVMRFLMVRRQTEG